MKEELTMRPMTRRHAVQTCAALGAGAMALSQGTVPTAALGSEQHDRPAYTAGTYQAKARGKKSTITVEVTFSQDAIEDISLVNHRETGLIAETALAAIQEQVVALQALDIDTAAGATFTSFAILEAVKDCVRQAGADPDKLVGAASQRTASTGKTEVEADLVVVGAGGAGLPVAITAAQNGLSVVVLEKCSFVGGSMLVSDGRLQYPNAPVEYRQETTPAKEAYFAGIMARAAELGAEPELIETIQSGHDEWVAAGNTTVYDSREFYGLETAVLDNNIEGYEINAFDADASLTASQWFYDELGIPLEKPILGITAYKWPRSSHPDGVPCGEAFIDAIVSHIEASDFKDNIRFMLSTSADELIVDGEQVVGVSATGASGETHVVRGARGVVLATGGYGDSPEWLSKLDPEWGFSPDGPVPTVNPYGHTGDGLSMASKVGAGTYGLGALMLIPYAHPTNYTLDHLIGDGTNPLVVNIEGKRFMDETSLRTTLAKHVMEQPDELCYLICCEKNSCIKENGLNYACEDVESLLEYGSIYKADTLEELAKQIDMDPEVLTQTVADYNALCQSGGPDEFGRTYFEANASVDEGPFYASPGTWATLCTIGGLSINEKSEVLKEDGTAIPGLWAVGEVAMEPYLGAAGYGLMFARETFGK